MEITELTCPNCCAPLELNRSTGLAKCPYCDSTFLHSQPKKSEKKQPVKKPEKKGCATTENGRVGDRPYARGRSYSPEHYGE